MIDHRAQRKITLSSSKKNAAQILVATASRLALNSKAYKVEPKKGRRHKSGLRRDEKKKRTNPRHDLRNIRASCQPAELKEDRSQRIRNCDF